MSELLNVARAVADSLAEYNAELMYSPEFELSDLDKLHVVVIPVSNTYKLSCRSKYEERPKVQIGILKRCSQDELDGMIEFIEKLGLGFLNQSYAKATCVSVGYNPIYSPEHLRERRQFTGIIELGFVRFEI